MDHDDDEEFHYHGEDSDSMDSTSEEIEGLEKLTINSVGIDIGSSTTHLIFSRLILRREGSAFSSNFKVAERQVIYRSPIMLTPYLSGVLIDVDKIQEFVQQAYRQAGLTPETIDTGAVVITGEALKKENAQPISELFAREAGKFICASAGPNHEALLAAHGCGAVALSQDRGATVLNIDVGGGTTKLSLIKGGVVVNTGAIEVGARLIAFDESNLVTRLEEPGKAMLESLGYSISLGQQIDDDQKDAVAALMAGLLMEAVGGRPMSQLARDLMLTDQLRDYSGPSDVDFLMFSGGVSEYIYGHEASTFGDLGAHLGRSLRRELSGVFEDKVLQETVNGIRATVIGAGEYTIQASGSTSHLSGVDSLPIFGLKVVRPFTEPAVSDGVSLEQSLQTALQKFDLNGFGPGLALALSIDETPNYPSLRRMADAVSSLINGPDSVSAPVFIVVDMDVAKSLGGILKDELHVEEDLVVVDGIDVGDLDFVDIGRPMGISDIVPVTVKSLVFPTASEA
jgi:ethanolamine utilization protein EutA